VLAFGGRKSRYLKFRSCHTMTACSHARIANLSATFASPGRYNIVSETDLRDAAVKLERDYSHRTDIVEPSERPIAARTNIN